MTDPDPEPDGAPWPPGPSQYECPGRARQHYMTAERDDRGLVWTCNYCQLRYRFGQGRVDD